MAGIKDKFNSLELLGKYSLVHIVNGFSSFVVGDRVVHASLTLKNIFLVTNFFQYFVYQSA